MTVLAALSYRPIVRIDLGPLSVSPHGLLTVIGFLIAARCLRSDTRRHGIADDDLSAILRDAAVGAIVAARLVYVLNHWSAYESPLEWFQIWEGGVSLLGGISGGLAAAWFQARRRHLAFLPLLDLAAPWLPLGIAIGRIGDLIIADHLGAPTTLPFGYRCPEIVDVGRTVGSPCPSGQVVHLTAAYDLLVAALVAGTLIILRRRRLRLGTPTLLLAALYGSGRLAFDFLREDVRRFGLTGSQWAALTLVTASVSWLLIRRVGSDHHRGQDPVVPEMRTLSSARPSITELPAGEAEHHGGLGLDPQVDPPAGITRPPGPGPGQVGYIVPGLFDPIAVGVPVDESDGAAEGGGSLAEGGEELAGEATGDRVVLDDEHDAG